ncbi:hypothetical protein SDJN02_00130, partial [Cucurbita argyrosperma subsp. argyrosperma]
MALLNSRLSDSKFHRFPYLRLAIHHPRLMDVSFRSVSGDPLGLNLVGRCNFKSLRLNSSCRIQNRATPPLTEAFEPGSPPPQATGKRILLSDVVEFWKRTNSYPRHLEFRS